MPLRGFAACLALTSLACGGKVVFVAETGNGAGGGGGSTSSSSSTSSTSSSGGECASLTADLEAKTAAAQACNPMSQQLQCSGSVVMNDECGCASLVLNEVHPDSVASANTAYVTWAAASCGPHACGTPCQPISNGTCQPNADFTAGKCIPAGIK